MSTNEKDGREVELCEKAKERIKVVDALLGITRQKLIELRKEMEDCTPEEGEALRVLDQLAHEIYLGVIKVLYSVMERRGRFRNERGRNG